VTPQTPFLVVSQVGTSLLYSLDTIRAASTSFLKIKKREKTGVREGREEETNELIDCSPNGVKDFTQDGVRGE